MKKIDWFQDYLKVGRYPLPQEIQKTGYDIIINVSDEFIVECHLVAMKYQVKYFWFPLNECVGDMGINSIFGALQILYEAEKNKETVLLHCHAGANRSQVIADCFYFLKYKTHRDYKTINNNLSGLFPESKEFNENNLQRNCRIGRLPKLEKMEIFLKEAEKFFQKMSSDRSGAIDSIKYKMENYEF